MKVLAWNICHGGGNRALVAALVAHEPDVIVLSEYRHRPTNGIVDQLRFFGWPHSVHSYVLTGENGVAIISKRPLDLGVGVGDGALRRWTVEASIEGTGLSVIGVYAPLPGTNGQPPGSQRLFWRALHDTVERRTHERLLITGDFNTCAKGVDGPGVLACADAIEQPSHLGMGRCVAGLQRRPDRLFVRGSHGC